MRIDHDTAAAFRPYAVPFPSTSIATRADSLDMRSLALTLAIVVTALTNVTAAQPSEFLQRLVGVWRLSGVDHPEYDSLLYQGAFRVVLTGRSLELRFERGRLQRAIAPPTRPCEYSIKTNPVDGDGTLPSLSISAQAPPSRCQSNGKNDGPFRRARLNVEDSQRVPTLIP